MRKPRSYRRKFYHRRSVYTSNALGQNNGVNIKGLNKYHKTRKQRNQETDKERKR